MATTRVYILAKELGVKSSSIVMKCQAEGLDIKNHMSVISAGLAAKIREWFSEGENYTVIEKPTVTRVYLLAEELGVKSSSIVMKCQAEGLDIKNHMSVISVGLAATIREWFSEGDQLTTVETSQPVDLTKARLKKKVVKKTEGDEAIKKHNALQNDFTRFLKKEKRWSEINFANEDYKTMAIDLSIRDPESKKLIAVFNFKKTIDRKIRSKAKATFAQFAELDIGKYLVTPSNEKSNYSFAIYKYSDRGLVRIQPRDFPAYEEGEPETPNEKLTLYDFKSKLDIVGKKIFDKVVDIATSSNIKLYTDIPDESYVNLRLTRSKGKSDTNVVIQIHRYGEDKRRIALAVAGIKTGATGLTEPKLNDYITKGVMSLLSGYKKGIPGEIAWLKGNRPVKGTREEVSIYVIERDILVNIEAWNGVEELFEWAVENFDKLPSEEPDKGGEISQRIAGVSNDNVVDDDGPLEDWLGIEGEVNALSAVIAAKGTEPPLSIGLFGDWGSGKSFFMGKMRQRITAIAEESERCVKNNEESYFCQNVVQITFNAWHYMDANLWASLVTHIFDKLAEHLTGGEEAKLEQKKKMLFENVESAKKLCEAAEKKKQKAVDLKNSASEKLEHIKDEEVKATDKLSDIGAKDILLTVVSDEKVKQQLNIIACKLGLGDGKGDYTEVCKAVDQARDLSVRIKLAVKNVFSRKNATWKILLCTMLIASLATLLGYIVQRFTESGLFANLSGIVGGVLALGVSLTKTLKPWLKQISVGMTLFEDTEKRINEMQGQETQALNKEKISLEQQIRKLANEEDQVNKDLNNAERLVEQAQEELDEIKTGRRLYNFILDRSGESKYKNQLGIIAQIREDFKGLSELVTESRKDDTPGELRKIERIVLYIDDLDRCPSDRVVEVLQAVHLILAFKLFIVVVGVDCRWILHALRKEYSAFGGGDGKFEESGRRWLTTPHNYVEKIFQIPFALEQMEDDGYRELVRVLTEAGEAAEVEEKTVDDSELETGRQKTAASEQKTRGEEAGHENEPSEEEQASESGGEMNMKPDELRLEEWEVEFMKELGDFISSPRAAKRFVNIYMLICATLTDRERLANFKGTKDGGGDYKAVQLMLGILTGFPNQACDLLKAIRDNAEEEKDIREFVKKLKTRKVRKSAPAIYRNIAKSEISETERGAWIILHGILEDKINKLEINTSFKPFGDWAGLVGRFSFQYGRASELQADEDEDEG